jgi:biopolymer transport protein ExbD
VPVVIKNVPVQLPNARNIPTTTKPENIVIAVDKHENVYWDNQPVDVSALKERFAGALRDALAKGMQLPEVHIRGDREARFEAIGKVILACQQAGIQKVGFITEPRNEAS